MATLADLLIEIGIDTSEITKGTQEIEGKFKRTWKGVQNAAAIGGAAIGGAVLAGLNSAIETSKPLATLEAQLGAGTPAAANAGKAAGLVFSKGVVGSLEDATASVKGALQNALVPPDASATAIAEAGSKISNLATIMEEDAGKVSVAVSQMIRTGLVDSAEEGFDVLQRGVEMGVNKSEDLLDTFNEYGTQFRKIGLDGPAALGLMSQALQAGARDSDTVADALKEFSIQAVSGNKAASDAFKLLGFNAEEMTAQIARGGADAEAGLYAVLDALRGTEDPVKRNAAAVGLFGTKAEDLGDALYAMNPETATKGLGNLAGAAGRAGDALEQSAGAKLEAFKRSAQQALVEQLAKAIPYLEATFGWLQRNSGWVTPLAIGLGALATAIGLVTLATKAWGIALAVTPIGWIVIGIAAVVAGIVLLATKTQFFQTIWKGVWGFFKTVGAWFAGPFVNFFKSAWGWITNQFNAAKTRIMLVVNTLKAGWMAYWNTYKSVVGWILDKGAQFVNFFIRLPGRIRGALSNMFSGLWTGFRNVANKIIAGWNNLQFTIGGGSVAGISIPSMTLGTPNIPYLAEGGIVTGPTLAVIGEGRQDEAVIPLDRLPEMAGGGGNTTVVQIVPGGEKEFRRWIQKSIRVTGPVQYADGMG